MRRPSDQPGAFSRARLSLYVLCLITFSFGMIHGSAAVTGPLLRTLTSAQQAHGLPHEEAERAYPVHLARAIVHYYDSETGLLFVGDSTGSVFVDMRGQKPIKMAPGDIVTVDGVSSGGDVAPIISRPHVLVIGKGTLPPHRS
jgi:hypothetical protein